MRTCFRMRIVAKKYDSLFIALFTTFVLFGTSATVVGAALPAILRDLHWSYGVAGAIMGAGAFGSFLALYLGGKLIDRLGARALLAGGFALDAASLVFFGATPSPMLNIGLYFALGLGQGCLEVAVNWASLHMDEEGAGRPMNFMHGAFSIGAAAGPFLMGILLASGLGWTTLYRGISFIYIGLFLVTFVMPLQRLPKAGKPAAGNAKKAGGAIRYLGFIALFFYVGTELGLSNWAAEYFVRDFAWGAPAASFIVSIFWAGLAAGRFGIPIFWKRARPDRLLVVLSILLAVAVSLLATLGFGGNAAAPLAAIAVALAGFGASCVYTSIITLVGRASPDDSGSAIGVASSGGAFGSFAFPFLMSAIATAWGVQAGFFFYALMAFASLALCVVLVKSIQVKLARTN